MKKILLFLMLSPIALFSTEKADSIKSWNFGGLASFNFSQVSLTNWAAGGKSSSSGVAIFNVFGNYKKDNLSWENSLDMGYGLLKEQDNEVVKSNDKFDLNSKYGVKKTEKLYISTLFNFKTQFTPGYKYPNTTDAISKLLAPAYITLSIVADDDLSAIGSFGLDPGKKLRYEVGSFAKLELKTDVMKNVSLTSKLDLFSNYLHNPANIDINWDLLINMKINDYLSANLISNMIYDDDIKIAIDKNKDGIIERRGPRVQLKEMFGVGLSLKF